MSGMERGSFMWFMMAVTQIWISIKLMEEVDEAITTLFGASAAAAFLLALILFRREKREMMLNPLGHLQKEVHDDAIAKQGRGVMGVVGAWIFALVLGSVFL